MVPITEIESLSARHHSQQDITLSKTSLSARHVTAANKETQDPIKKTGNL